MFLSFSTWPQTETSREQWDAMLSFTFLCLPFVPPSAGDLQHIEKTTGQMLGFFQQNYKKSLEISNTTIKIYDLHICISYIYEVCVEFLSSDMEEQLSASGNTGSVSHSTVYQDTRRNASLQQFNQYF